MGIIRIIKYSSYIPIVYLIGDQRQVAQSRNHQIEGLRLYAHDLVPVRLEAYAYLALPDHSQHLAVVGHGS